MGFKLINDYSKFAYEDCKTFIVDQFKEEIDQISEDSLKEEDIINVEEEAESDNFNEVQIN